MYLGNRITHLSALALVVIINTAVAQAQSAPAAAFVDINDAVASRFFDAATTAADPANPNKLIIRFNSGYDPATWKMNDFRATTSTFGHAAAMDTISFRIVAPGGHYISKVTYTQRGTGSNVWTTRAAGASNWVVGDFAADLGVYGVNPSLSRSVDLSDVQWTTLPVSITTSLFTFSPFQIGAANVLLTSAEVVVEVQPMAIVE